MFMWIPPLMTLTFKIAWCWKSKLNTAWYGTYPIMFKLGNWASSYQIKFESCWCEIQMDSLDGCRMIIMKESKCLLLLLFSFTVWSEFMCTEEIQREREWRVLMFWHLIWCPCTKLGKTFVRKHCVTLCTVWYYYHKRADVCGFRLWCASVAFSYYLATFYAFCVVIKRIVTLLTLYKNCPPKDRFLSMDCSKETKMSVLNVSSWALEFMLCVYLCFIRAVIESCS